MSQILQCVKHLNWDIYDKCNTRGKHEICGKCDKFTNVTNITNCTFKTNMMNMRTMKTLDFTTLCGRQGVEMWKRW